VVIFLYGVARAAESLLGHTSAPSVTFKGHR